MHVVFRFGRFDLDPLSRQLLHGRQPVRLSTPQFKILHRLVVHANSVVPKESLIDEAWGRAAITENSLEKAISDLRKGLDEGRSDGIRIETIPHQGYRLTAPVQQVRRDGADAPYEVQLAPYLNFVRGQSAIDTLDLHAIRRSQCAFEEVLRDAPEYTLAKVGLAMACGLAFEASLPDPERDTSSLERGLRYARDACAQPPVSADAWSTLSYLRYLNGDLEEAAAAAFKAGELEPQQFRHALREAYVTWGERRLHAAGRLLRLCPGLAVGHWFRTTVFVARSAFDPALEELRCGCAAQDAQTKGAGFPAVGLHLLHGLLLATHGRLDEATAALKRELLWADSGQLYARACAANTWYALGALCRRQRKQREAEAAFTRALTIAPLHVSATAALRGEVPTTAGPMEMAIGEAIMLVHRERHADAARVYREAVARAPRGSAGSLLPVEPTLNPHARREVWADALAMIRARAT
jgi:DNA-binding winged helix-turn-helix (wHTH) protein